MREILKIIFKGWVAVLLMCLPFTSSAGDKQQAIQRFSLKNGLKIVVLPDNRSPIVINQVWYKVGSMYEPAGFTGISHVLEHMMFKGTARVPSGEFYKRIALLGGQQNAFTSRDHTVYYQKIAAAHLGKCFELEADRMQNLVFNSDAFKKELEVVKEERRMRVEDDPIMRTYERFAAVAQLGSPYHHMPIGWRHDLDRLTLSDVKAWYRAWYHPNNAVLVVMGAVKAKAVFKLAQRYFGAIPEKSILPFKATPYLAGLGKRSVAVRVPAKLPYVFLGYNVPSYRMLLATKQTAGRAVVTKNALAILAALLDGDSGLLHHALVRMDHDAVSVHVAYDSCSVLDTVFTFSIIPNKGVPVVRIEQSVQAQLDRLKLGQINQSDLERAKQKLIAEKIYTKDSLEAHAIEVGTLAAMDIDPSIPDEDLLQIRQVTLNDLKTVAKKYFVSEQLTRAILYPRDVKLRHGVRAVE